MLECVETNVAAKGIMSFAAKEPLARIETPASDASLSFGSTNALLRFLLGLRPRRL